MLKTRTLLGIGIALLAVAGTLVGPGPAARGQVIIQIPGGGIGNPTGPWGNPVRGGPTSRPATTRPVIKLDLKPVEPAKQQAEALAKVIDVNYRRDFPIEVLQDLNRRTGLRYALPGPLDKAYLFTFEAKGVTVKEVLVKLALAGQAQGEFSAHVVPDPLVDGTLDLRADLAVLTRQAGDQTLADLQKKLADPDRWERIHAVWGLANLADPRIYPPLVKMLADKDPGVVEWTLKGLEKHVLMVGLWPEANRNTLAEALLRWYDATDFADASNQFMGAWGFGLGAQPSASPTLRRFRLLAATRRPQAAAALVNEMVDEQEPIRSRCDAAAALGEFGLAEVRMLATMKQAQTKWEAYNKQKQAQEAAWWAAHNEEQKQGKPLTLPGNVFSWDPKIMDLQQLFMATRMALVGTKNPTVLPEALSDYLYPAGHLLWGVAAESLRQTREPQVIELMIRPRLAQVEALYGRDIPEPPPPMGVAVHGPAVSVTPHPTTRPMGDFFTASQALAALQPFDDPRVDQATARVVKNPAALKFVAGQWNPPTLKATDPAVLEALLTHAQETGPVGLLVARSLATSRDKRAAEALLAMLKSEDKELVGEAAMALANTHDSRALKALTDLLAQKIDWPDLEGAEMERMRQGKPGRSVINPRTLVVLGLLASRDPAAFDALLAMVSDPKADVEIDWLALAAQDAQSIEKLIAWVKQAEPANQQAVLLGNGAGNWLKQVARQREGIRELPLRCREDGRWPGLVGARVNDDDVTVYRQDGVTPQMNWAVETLKQIVSPDSELALLTITQGEDKDLAGFAARALKAFHDPGATPGAGAKKP